LRCEIQGTKWRLWIKRPKVFKPDSIRKIRISLIPPIYLDCTACGRSRR
jgi:hypothetical protein